MNKLKSYFVYSIVGGAVMIAAMLVGEYLHGPIFNGFLHKPHLWFLALLETVFWVIPLTWVVSVLIKKFPETKGASLVGLTMFLWVGLCAGVFLLYQVAFGDTRLPLWTEVKISLPFMFGWYIPGAITIILFSVLSPVVLRRK